MIPLLATLLIAQAHAHGGGDAGAASDRDSAVPAHQPHRLDAGAPRPRGEQVQLSVDGQSSSAYAARPREKPKGALLVIHEYWGLNDWMKHQADELADEGYLALAIDLYKGKIATDPKEAQQLMASKDEAWGDQVEKAGLEWLKKNAGGAKIATIGWCMGGGESLKASLNDPKDVSATVIYYGMPVTDTARLKTLRGPVLGIWANKDGWITKDKVAAFDQALSAAGVKHEFHAYDADHAFANPSGGRYNGKAAKDAREKTRAFLASSLR